MTATSAPTLVIGAGELGVEILYSLATHPDRGANPVAVLLRPGARDTDDRDKAELYRAMQTHSITFVSGDISNDDAPALAAIFASYHTIIGASGMIQAQGTQLKLARAVVAATQLPNSQVQRYIPWQFGLNYDTIGRGSAQGLFTEQLEVRDMLKAAQDRLSWVIVSTGIFMTFLFEPMFGVVVGLGHWDKLGPSAKPKMAQKQAEGGNIDNRASVGDPNGRPSSNSEKQIVRALGSWQNKVTYTTPSDIGRLTAEIVFAAPEVRNQVVFVAGDTASFEDVKAAVDKLCESRIGQSPEGEVWDLEHLREGLRASPDDGLKKYQVILAEGVGVAWDKSTSFNAQRGIPTQTVEQYVLSRYGGST